MKAKPAVSTTIFLAAFAFVVLTATTRGAEAAKGSSLPADLSKGLVLYYDFEMKPVGDKILDMSGRQNNGKATSVEWVADGHCGGAVKISGTSSYITVPKSGSMNPQPLTLSCWINIVPGSPAPIFLERTGQSWFKLSMWSGAPALDIQGKRVTADGGVNWWAEVGAWHHIAGTYDGDEQRIYVDGLPRGNVLRWNCLLYTSPSPRD